MKMHFACVMAAALLTSAAVLASSDETAPGNKPSLSASQTMTATARVEAIDRETREVTLLLDDGETVSMKVGEETQNLDQVNPGDMVYAHYTESISIEVVAGDGAEPEIRAQEDTARSAKGRMPGYAAEESTVITSVVEAIDLENNTFKLREPDGEIREYVARNPHNLTLAEVGDKVVTTITESVVLTVEKKAAD